MTADGRKAKHIKYMIRERADMGDADDAFEIADSANHSASQDIESDDEGFDDCVQVVSSSDPPTGTSSCDAVSQIAHFENCPL